MRLNCVGWLVVGAIILLCCYAIRTDGAQDSIYTWQDTIKWKQDFRGMERLPNKDLIFQVSPIILNHLNPADTVNGIIHYENLYFARKDQKDSLLYDSAFISWKKILKKRLKKP